MTGNLNELFAGMDIGAIDSEAVVQEEVRKRVFSPGRHDDVEIIGVEVKEAKDSNWRSLVVEYGKEGYYSRNKYVNFPINAEGVKAYRKSENVADEAAAKSAQMQLGMLRKFLVTLGFTVEDVTKLVDLTKLVMHVVKQKEKLIGMRQDIQFDYRSGSAYPDFQEKGVVHLVLGNGKKLMMEDDPDSPVVFASSKDAFEYGIAQLGLKKYEEISQSAEIREVHPPTTPNDLKAFNKKAKGDVVDSDLL